MSPHPVRGHVRIAAVSVVFWLAACSRGPTQPPDVPGTSVSPPLSPEEQAERERLAGALTAVAGLDTAGLQAAYPVSFTGALSYDPLGAVNLDLIRGSRLGLTAAEEQVLADKGFVITDRQRFPGFTYGYASIYSDDLPVFISADSILYAVHRSYDQLLEGLETQSLRPTLDALLVAMRASLAAGALGPLGGDTVRDLDLYLAVPLALLRGTPQAPVAGASASEIADLVNAATAAQGPTRILLFGTTRDEDMSQFKPRGHYTDSPELETYFRAMMWLGRLDFRMIETQDDGSQVFRRRHFDGALGVSALVTGEARASWDRLNTAIQAFVGEADSMQLPEFPALLARLGTQDLAGVVALDDATIADAIVAGNFGAQRIASHIMIAGLHDQAFPLSRSFLLLGQRYVVDSHVFSNVVYDRVSAPRMMPDPLDVAFAALGNNQAGVMLAPQLDKYAYAPALGAMRLLVDDHGDAFWGANLYNLWLSSLRALSPAEGRAVAPVEVAGTEPWGRRLLETQLASWAELRHDTILYVKQSYTSGVICAFPDALVEPNPDFFARLGAFAQKGGEVIASLGLDADPNGIGAQATEYFSHLGQVAGMLQEMAQAQLAGTPFSDAQMAFINETVTVQQVCGGAFASGWYPKLFFASGTATDFDPTIADVHTEVTDETGNEVGRVLHVGTGYARLMVLTANTCQGVRAYAGLASSYYETTRDAFQRLDDPTWVAALNSVAAPPADVPWVSDLVVHP